MTNLDNEYSQGGFGHAEYFQELEDAYRAGDVVIPLTYNDPGQRKNFVNGTVSHLYWKVYKILIWFVSS